MHLNIKEAMILLYLSLNTESNGFNWGNTALGYTLYQQNIATDLWLPQRYTQDNDKDNTVRRPMHIGVYVCVCMHYMYVCTHVCVCLNMHVCMNVHLYTFYI